MGVLMKILINIYYTFILPYFIYLLGNVCDSYLDPNFKLQKRAIQFITVSSYKTRTNPLFNQLKILPLNKLVIQLLYVYIFHENLTSGTNEPFFNEQLHT